MASQKSNEYPTKKVSILNRTYTVAGRNTDNYFKDLPETSYFENYFYYLQQIIKSDSICLDVGANIGLVSLALSQLNPKGKTYAFEPTPDIYSILKRNIDENVIENVETVQLALSDKKGKLAFVDVEWYPAGNFSVEDNQKNKWGQYGNILNVAAEALDVWVTKNKLKSVDFLKIDVEGAELQVLEGAKKTIAKFKPLVVMEFNSYCYILHQNKTPIDAIRFITEYFGKVYRINRTNSTLELIENNEKALLVFVDSNLRNGFVDDLFCLPKGMTLPHFAGKPYSLTALEEQISKLQVENNMLHNDLIRVMNRKTIKLLNKIRSLW